MDSYSKDILSKQMTISEIQKKWNVPPDRAVRLFCRATGSRRPNTDHLDQWSKQVLRKISLRTSPSTQDCCGGHCEGGGCDHSDHSSGCGGCSGCHS